ncbi:hypothetical protein V9T40_001412 [Parthenolecanium corni]|uniref:Uncharacterized protein n=1 Tax=Parthenolecanium corni TaxID=536013 RepID=A0AAN9Y2N8_9HEMI
MRSIARDGRNKNFKVDLDPEFGSPFLIKLSAFGLPVFPSKINGFRLLAFGFQLASELCLDRTRSRSFVVVALLEESKVIGKNN